MKGHIRLLSAALVLALAPAARAQTAGDVDTQVSSLNTTTANAGQTRVATRIASSFSSLAGSQDNALALVDALRNGTSVTLTSPDDATVTGTGTTSGTGGTSGTGTTASTGTTITPPTGKMGWGEVFISLALAKAELANLGIANPTPDQLQAALTGGSITQADGTVVQVKGVLEMRADGMGWGQIAQAEGTKLGPVVSSIKSAHARMASLSTSTTAAGSTTASKRLASTTTASGSRHGIVTAGGSSSVVASERGSRGIATASGVSAGPSSRGIMTAEGSLASGSANGHAYGRGLVTAAGGSASGLVAANVSAASHGAGLVTAAGSSAATSAGITTAEGGGGNGNANGHGHGHKGGG